MWIVALERIKREFLSQECDRMQAIEALQEDCGMSSLHAEETIELWEDEVDQARAQKQ